MTHISHPCDSHLLFSSFIYKCAQPSFSTSLDNIDSNNLVCKIFHILSILGDAILLFSPLFSSDPCFCGLLGKKRSINNSRFPIAQIGNTVITLRFSSSQVTEDVFHIPKMKINLQYVVQLTTFNYILLGLKMLR